MKVSATVATSDNDDEDDGGGDGDDNWLKLSVLYLIIR